MGKVEKFVVLGVLSLIVVILIVSQNSDPSNAKDRQDLSNQGEQRSPFAMDEGLADVMDPLMVDPDPELPPGGLLYMGPGSDMDGEEGNLDVEPVPGPPEPAPGEPLGSLITTRRLSSGVNPELRYYVCSTNDSFESIAKTYYGDASFARLLRHHNEGTTRLVRGMEVTVPVDDDGLSGGTVHIVETNESLWKIAAKHYGAGHRWNEIYEANRDQLKSADDLSEGMKLLIP
jgi:hypothetical protein